MIGLAKTADVVQVQQAQAPVIENSQPLSPMTYEGIPVEFFEFFDVDMRALDTRAKVQLKELFDMSKDGCKDMGDVVTKISEIDRKLGAPAFNESRYGRVWSYLKISRRMGDLEKQRMAMENSYGNESR